MCVEIERALGLGDALMARIYSRRNWSRYLHPSAAYTSLESYTYATRAAQARPRRGRARVPGRGRRSRGRPPQAPARGAQGRTRRRRGPCAGARPAYARGQARAGLVMFYEKGWRVPVCLGGNRSSTLYNVIASLYEFIKRTAAIIFKLNNIV